MIGMAWLTWHNQTGLVMGYRKGCGVWTRVWCWIGNILSQCDGWRAFAASHSTLGIAHSCSCHPSSPTQLIPVLHMRYVHVNSVESSQSCVWWNETSSCSDDSILCVTIGWSGKWRHIVWMFPWMSCPSVRIQKTAEHFCRCFWFRRPRRSCRPLSIQKTKAELWVTAKSSCSARICFTDP